MRGVGASGASRALVVVDDIPLNDPFGGWVYWDRVYGNRSVTSKSFAAAPMPAFTDRRPWRGDSIPHAATGSDHHRRGKLMGKREHARNVALGRHSGGPWYGSASTDLFRTNGYIPCLSRNAHG